MKIKLLMLISFCYLNVLFAQKENYIWYFGDNAGLDFNSGTPVVLTNGMLTTSEGCASISDSGGSIMFYTDGITVWDKNHNQMPNGFGLGGGGSSTQSALIVPFPGNNSMFYIFTPEEYGTAKNFTYSVVDMSLNNGNGNVTTKNNFLMAPVSEKLTGVKHSNNTDIWVMAHGDGINSFYAYLVTSAGIASPVISTVGVFSTFNDGVGQMKFSSDGTKIAYASWGGNYIDLFDFNTTTGSVTNEKLITIPPGTMLGAYGLEFSASGDYLYCAGVQTHTVHQWDVTSNSAAIINSTRQLIDSSLIVSVYGQMQLGPDGKIYIARDLTSFLSVINNPELAGPSCNFVVSGISFTPGYMSRLGLPNFVTSFFLPTGISNLQSPISNFQIFPNPASDKIYISFPEKTSETITIKIFSVTGEKLFQSFKPLEKLNAPEIIDVSGFSNGIYFLSLQTVTEVVTRKIVVQH